MRIISGKYGKRLLVTPKGFITHPMGERIRQAMFNSLLGKLEDAEVLDAFAGSGALGLEAISRGAKHATFVERDRGALMALDQNIKSLKCEDDTRVVRRGVSSFIDDEVKKYDIIFADPPYNKPQLSTASKLLDLLKPGGYMILSYPGRGEAPPSKHGIVVVDNRGYGNAALAFYRREE
jgi:16S rRNA (guanine966-N2)-methyltransferase